MKFAALCLIVLATYASATPKAGPCPKVTTSMTSIDLKQMDGFWFEWGQYNAFFEGGTCVATNYTYGIGAHGPSENAIECLDRSYKDGKFINDPTDPKRVLEWLTCEPNDDGTWAPDCQMVVTQGGVSYTILSTDFSSYNIAYSCVGIGVTHLPLLWVTTRDNVPSDDVLALIKTKVDNFPNLEVKYEDLDLQTDHYPRKDCCGLYKNFSLLPDEVYSAQCSTPQIS